MLQCDKLKFGMKLRFIGPRLVSTFNISLKVNSIVTIVSVDKNQIDVVDSYGFMYRGCDLKRFRELNSVRPVKRNTNIVKYKSW